MNEEQRPQNENYKVYLEHKRHLDRIKEENERILGRNTLIIAGGAFALSVTLLKDLYPDPIFWSKWFLIASWVTFGFSAFLQIYSDSLSSLAVDIELEKLKACYINGIEDARKKDNIYDTRVKIINGLTPWLMTAGFVFVVIFSATNFLNEKEGTMDKSRKTVVASPKTNASEKKMKRGATMPEIPIKKKFKHGVTPPEIPPKQKPSDTQSEDKKD